MGWKAAAPDDPWGDEPASGPDTWVTLTMVVVVIVLALVLLVVVGAVYAYLVLSRGGAG